MDKSYVTLATKYCPMCGEEWETGEILMDRQLKNRFDRQPHHDRDCFVRGTRGAPAGA
jgi:hypothetical protein